MYGKSNENIIRMEEEDRIALNEILEHKLPQFKSAITDGIVALLSTQTELSKLSSVHAQHSDSLNAQSQQKKEQLNTLTKIVDESASKAPMGIGGAAHLVLSGANAIGTAIIDKADFKRHQSDAAAQLYASTLLYHVTDKIYHKPIAERVANILGDWFRLLVLRLNGGNDGFMKLANFFIASMKKNAIDGLREHPEQPVKAFIDAAIPDLNTISYITWPQLDSGNINCFDCIGNLNCCNDLSLHMTLELDEDVNQILRRCGKAVHSLTGGVDEYVDPDTLELKPYNTYTIVGALNHAAILKIHNDKVKVIKGLEAKSRKIDFIDGSMKYPAILIANVKTTSEMGYSFGTKDTRKYLNDYQVRVLKRMCPDFFQHTPDYNVVSDASTPPPESTNPANQRYTNERYYEYRWTTNKQEKLQKRVRYILTAGKQVSDTEEGDSTVEQAKQQAMEMASYRFDAEEAKQDAMQATKEAMQAQIDVYAAAMKTGEHNNKRLQAAKAAMYAATAVSEMIHCVKKANSPEIDYYPLSLEMIDAARVALYASRGLPIEEAIKRKKIKTMLHHAVQCAESAFLQQNFCLKNFQIVLDFVNATENFAAGDNFYEKETQIRSKIARDITNQIEEIPKKSLKLIEVATKTANYWQDVECGITQEKILNQLVNIASEIRVELDTTGLMPSDLSLLKTIEICVLSIQINHYNICKSLENSDAQVNINPDWIKDPVPTHLQPDQIKEKARQVSEEACHEVSRIFNDATARKALTWIWNRTKFKNDLIAARNRAIALRDISLSIQNNITIDMSSGLNSAIEHDAHAYFMRVAALAELGILHFVASQKEQGLTTENILSPLQRRLAEFRMKIRQLEFTSKTNCLRIAKDAENTFDDQMRQFTNQIPFHDMLEKARRLNQSLDEVEHAVMDDFEVEKFVIRKTQQSIDEAKHALQGIIEINSKLCMLKNHCLEVMDSDDSLSTSSHSTDDLVLENTPDSASTSNSTNTDEQINRALEQLRLVTMAFETDDAPASNNSSGYYQDIIRTLQQLIGNCTDQSSPVHIPEQTMKNNIIKNLNWLKNKISDNPCSSLVHTWGAWLITNVVILVVQTVHTKDQGIPYLVKEAKHTVERIKQTLSKESAELKNARDDALSSIKQACQDIYHANHGLLEEKISPEYYREQKWTMEYSTMAWAARLNIKELKSLHKRADEIQRIRQSQLKSVQEKISNLWSDKTIVHKVSLGLFDLKLMDAERTICELNICNKRLEKCQTKINDIKRDRHESRHSLEQLDQMQRMCNKLVEKIEKKRKFLEPKKSEWEASRNNLSARTLSVSWEEFKRKNYDPNALPLGQRIIKGAKSRINADNLTTKDGNKQINHPEHIETLRKKMNLSEVEATNITLEEIKTVLDSLEKRLYNISPPPVSDKPARSTSFFKKTPQTPKVNNNIIEPNEVVSLQKNIRSRPLSVDNSLRMLDTNASFNTPNLSVFAEGLTGTNADPSTGNTSSQVTPEDGKPVSRIMEI